VVERYSARVNGFEGIAVPRLTLECLQLPVAIADELDHFGRQLRFAATPW
jgi:hypothetical protein